MVRLEIAAAYAGVNILLLLILAFRVTSARRKNKVALGDAGNADVLRAIRVHANAAEYIPAGIAGITLLALLEPAAPLWLLHASGASLTLGRILHGIGFSMGVLNIGRMAGTILTFTALALIGGGLLWAAFAQQI